MHILLFYFDQTWKNIYKLACFCHTKKKMIPLNFVSQDEDQRS